MSKLKKGDKLYAYDYPSPRDPNATLTTVCISKVGKKYIYYSWSSTPWGKDKRIDKTYLREIDWPHTHRQFYTTVNEAVEAFKSRVAWADFRKTMRETGWQSVAAGVTAENILEARRLLGLAA